MIWVFAASTSPKSPRGFENKFLHSLVSRTLATFEKSILFEVFFSYNFCLFWALSASGARKPPLGSENGVCVIFNRNEVIFNLLGSRNKAFLTNIEFKKFKIICLSLLFLVSMARWAHLRFSSMLLHSCYGQINGYFSNITKFCNFLINLKFFHVSKNFFILLVYRSLWAKENFKA